MKCISNIVKETSTIFRQTREGNVVFGADMDDEAEALAVFCFCKGFDITQVDASIYFVFIADNPRLEGPEARPPGVTRADGIAERGQSAHGPWNPLNNKDTSHINH